MQRQNRQKAQESSPGVNERKDKEQWAKGWRSVRKIPQTFLSFVTCQYSSPALPFFSLPRPWAIYHTDGKSETHWVGWSIAWGCLTAGKDASIWRTVHSRCRKWPAGAFAVYVVKVGRLTRSALFMDCRPGRPCTSDCSAFCGLRDGRRSTSFKHSLLS